MNPFRRNPEDGAIGVLQKRSTLYKQGPHYKTATRNPAWIKVRGVGNGCIGTADMTLPSDDDTFETTYNTKKKLKLGPILKEVVLEYGGEFGLTQTITITIECYSREDFERVEKAFLLPGNEITCKFGYGKSWCEADQKYITPEGSFRVVTFNFSTTTEGYWVATCKAVAAAEALKDIEVSSMVLYVNNDAPLKYLDGKKKFPVTGMAELIAYDAQKNGEKSIDEMQDGETIKPAGGGAIVVYHSDHLFSNRLGTWWNQLTNKFDNKTEAEQTANTVYLSLEYIVKRLLMGQIKKEILKGVIKQDHSSFDKLNIVFDPEMSNSWISTYIRSGSPITCLLMGINKGNYKNDFGEGKNFEKDCKNLEAVKAIEKTADGRQKVIHKNILLERGIVVKAFTEAAKNRKATADSVDVKDTKELVLPIEDFLRKIFDHIGICTGGALQLRLIVHPKNKNQLVIVDQNNGHIEQDLQVAVLNPIDGDGSTRSCIIQSNVGSEEYKAYMFAGVSRKGDGAASIRGCKESADNLREQETYKDAKHAMNQVIFNPGALGANQFGGVQENALVQIMGTLSKSTPKSLKYEMIPYMGMSIEVELDGVYGFVPGNGISTKQLPSHYKKNKNYFQIKTVTHIFSAEDSSWTTKLSGFMTFFDQIKWIDL